MWEVGVADGSRDGNRLRLIVGKAETARPDGLVEIRSVGSKDGAVNGVVVVVDDGNTVGRVDGALLIGTAEIGWLVGAPEGSSEGGMLVEAPPAGALVGAVVGREEGLFVGASVGRLEGALVGSSVGSLEGALVGASVGR